MSASIVLAAVATQHKSEERFEALREVVRRLMAVDPDRRLACLSVIKPASDLAGGKVRVMRAPAGTPQPAPATLPAPVPGTRS